MLPNRAKRTIFQSTHPLRGATLGVQMNGYNEKISIHAPLAGCDCLCRLVYRKGAGISIHAPLAGCDVVCLYLVVKYFDFNPRTPCGVRPVKERRFKNIQRISIHAPLAGCDENRLPPERKSLHFNPRTPCGVRPFQPRLLQRAHRFQSTHPLRGATYARHNRKRKHDISIHAPLAGCDSFTHYHHRQILNFNPRTPCGVRLLLIVSPRRIPTFQSTHPLRGATSCQNVPNSRVIISIHAPLAGCDSRRHDRGNTLKNFNPRTPCGVRPAGSWQECSAFRFQSTHPLRGATGEKLVKIRGIFHFNPRTPCGVRRSASFLPICTA